MAPAAVVFDRFGGCIEVARVTALDHQHRDEGLGVRTV